MSAAAWALRTAREVGPIPPPHAHAHPIHKLHTGPLHSTVAGRTDHLPSQVPNGSFVLPADIVSGLGEGNTMSGFKAAKRMFEGAHREFGGTPYAGSNGPYGQGTGLPYAIGHASGGVIGRNEKQTLIGPGTEEWQSQPCGGVMDSNNAVTGPTMPEGDQSFQQQLQNNRNRQDIIDRHIGTEMAKGGGVIPVIPPSHSQNMNPAFNKWFGKSKVVDNRGQPLRVYKGMNSLDNNGKYITSIDRKSDFPAFNRGEPGYKIAGFFSHDPNVANRFSQVYGGNGGSASTYPVHLKMERPYEVDAKGEKAGNMMFGDSGKPLRDALRSGKHDGAIIRNTADEGHVYIPLHPTQIKSAIGNNGDFNPANPDIGMASGGAVDQAVPVAVAGGEHVLAPHEVAFAGMGDVEAGHKALEAFVLRQRAKLIKTLKGLPGPKRD